MTVLLPIRREGDLRPSNRTSNLIYSRTPFLTSSLDSLGSLGSLLYCTVCHPRLSVDLVKTLLYCTSNPSTVVLILSIPSIYSCHHHGDVLLSPSNAL